MEKDRFLALSKDVQKSDRVKLFMDLLLEEMGINPDTDMKDFFPKIREVITKGNEAMVELTRGSMIGMKPKVTRKKRKTVEVFEGKNVPLVDENGHFQDE